MVIGLVEALEENATLMAHDLPEATMAAVPNLRIVAMMVAPAIVRMAVVAAVVIAVTVVVMAVVAATVITAVTTVTAVVAAGFGGRSEGEE